MSEHAFVAILGIAFTVVFLGGLLELTRLPEEEYVEATTFTRGFFGDALRLAGTNNP